MTKKMKTASSSALLSFVSFLSFASVSCFQSIGLRRMEFGQQRHHLHPKDPKIHSSAFQTTTTYGIPNTLEYEESSATANGETSCPGRRQVLQDSLLLASSVLLLGSEAALASGGATAGKYTTIPIAKRRYYGRVQEGVHEFLLMGPDVVKGDMNAALIQNFFDPKGAVIVPARNQAINGQCTKQDQSCKGKEIRDSRYNDMKASMYLLGNAFRTDQQKPPDRLPTVKAAKAFFVEMDAMQKLVQKPKVKDAAAVQRYAKALDLLDSYLDLVELPPTESGYYEQEFDTQVGVNARLT